MAPSVGEKHSQIAGPSFCHLLFDCLLPNSCVCVCAQKFESWWIQSMTLVRGEMGALTILTLHSGLQFGLEVCRKQWIGLLADLHFY